MKVCCSILGNDVMHIVLVWFESDRGRVDIIVVICGVCTRCVGQYKQCWIEARIEAMLPAIHTTNIQLGSEETISEHVGVGVGWQCRRCSGGAGEVKVCCAGQTPP